VPQIEIVSEEQGPSGWRFVAQILDDHGRLHRRTIDLSWADYNHWSPDGSARPADVAGAALRFWLSRADVADIREQFDAAMLRRLFDDADAQITKFI